LFPEAFGFPLISSIGRRADDGDGIEPEEFEVGFGCAADFGVVGAGLSDAGSRPKGG